MRLDHLLSKRHAGLATPKGGAEDGQTAVWSAQVTHGLARMTKLSTSTLLPFLYYVGRQEAPGEPSALGGCKARGYSSVARAVALQAIGLGFKSPYLQLDATAQAAKVL